MAIQSVTIFSNSVGGHAGVGGHDDLDRSPCSPPASAPFTSPLSSDANGSLSFHSGCCGRERLDAVEREEQLEVHRLLGPERAVVVEGGDALGGRDEVRRALLRHLRDEVDDGLLGRAVVPGRQRVGGDGRQSQPEESEGRERRFASCPMHAFPWRSGRRPVDRAACHRLADSREVRAYGKRPRAGPAPARTLRQNGGICLTRSELRGRADGDRTVATRPQVPAS